MARGRPPVPTQLKIIRGAQPCRINKREPKPEGDLTEAPAHFDAELREVWAYAIENAPAGLLRKLDSSVLEIWCKALVTHRRASIELSKSGLLVKAPNTGLPIQSPWLPIVNKQALIMMRAVDQLGFSPAARTRIMTGEAAPAISDWSEIASG